METPAEEMERGQQHRRHCEVICDATLDLTACQKENHVLLDHQAGQWQWWMSGAGSVVGEVQAVVFSGCSRPRVTETRESEPADEGNDCAYL